MSLPVTKAERNEAAAVQAPVLPPAVIPPSAPAPATFAPPPLPGQLKAESPPASPPGAVVPLSKEPPPLSGALKGLPPLPKGSSAADDRTLKPVPRTPLTSSKGKAVSSTSSSGQFIVHGEDLPLRSAFSGRCDEIAESLRQLLRDNEPWVLPIVVLLKTGEAAKAAPAAVSYSISKIPNGGFHLQVNANVRGDMRPADLRSEVIRVLLAERILRNQTELSKRPRLLPDWVFTGVLEALDYRQRARPSALFAAIFKSGKIYSIEEIIEASPVEMDALSKSIYQTSCCALVMALLDQPDGGLRLGKFLNALAADARPERDLLNQWFPNFATTPASLNKWWSLQLASMANPSVSEPLSPTETVRQLEAALTLHYKAKPSEIPHPRIAAHIPDEPEPPAKKEAETAAAAASANEGPNKKPSILHRLNPFAKKEPTDDQVIAAAMKEAALAEAKVTGAASALDAAEKQAAKKADSTASETAAEVADAAPAKKPFMKMGWLFGSGDKKKEKAGEEKTAPDEKEKLAADKKAAEEKAKATAAEEKKEAEAKRKMEAAEKAQLAEERRAADEKKAAEAKAKVAEEKKLADMKAKAADEKKLADAKAKAAEEKRTADAKAKAAEEKKTADAKTKAAEEKKLADAKTKAAEEKKAADAKEKGKSGDGNKLASKKPDTKVADKDEPKKAGPATDETVVEKKASGRGPLNWFRGKKKTESKSQEKDAKKDEEPAAKKKESAGVSLSTTAARMLWAWSPLAGDAVMLMQEQAADSAGSRSRQVEGFLGLKFGKKKDAASGESGKDKEEPKAKAKEEPKSKNKEEPKPKAKDEPKAKEEPKETEKAKSQQTEEPKPKGKPDTKVEQKVEKKKSAATPKEPEPAKDSEVKKPESKKPDNKKTEAPKPEPQKPEPAKKEEPQKEESKKPQPAPASAEETKHEPIKIRPLFGSGKKSKEEPAPAADKPKEEPPPVVEKEKPKPAAPVEKATRKPAVENEAMIDAAVPLEGYAAIMKRKDCNDILRHNRTVLLALQTRVAVLFRPIVTEYAEIVSGLVEGKTKGVDERLHSLRLRTAAALKKSKAVRDFLDVYEANESPTFSGLFDDYLKLPETISKELPERSDPMSKYLDALDKEFSGH